MRFRQGFDVLQMTIRVFVEYYTRVQDAVRVKQLFHILHQFKSSIAPFATDKGRHVATRAVFGFQGTFVFVHHQIHDFVHHVFILRNSLRRIESLVQDEMVVAVVCMAVNDRFFIAVFIQNIP